MRVCAFLSILLLSLLLVAFFSAVPVHAAPTWSIQTIDSTSAGGGLIAIDSNNNPHILYAHYESGNAYSGSVHPGPSELMYASWNGSTWNTQPIPPEIEYVFNFVLDSNNNPHILYNAGFDRLMIASWTGSNWTLQTVTKEGSTSRCFLALDSAGNPHVAYTTDLGNPLNPIMLKYASWTGANWSIQNVDSYSSVGQYSSMYLALDSNNNPHIMYGNETHYPAPAPNGGINILYSVKFATWNGSTWNIQTAFSDLSYYGNMVLDSKGYPHFVYRQDYPISHSGNSTLFYASWNGSAWNSQTVVSNANLGPGTSFLALDSYDYPHIDYCNASGIDSDSGSLVYAGWTGSVWDMQIVGPNSLATQAGPIAMDSHGNAHIAYTGLPASFPISLIVYSMYATATEPIYTPTPSPTQVPSSTFSAFTSLIILSVFIIVIVATLVYAWKKKTKKSPKGCLLAHQGKSTRIV
jgi:hypothetical protein